MSAWLVGRRNPELRKALLASGLQRAAVMVVNTLATNNLRALVWKDKLAENTAILSICLCLAAIATGGPVGRLGDQVGRRAAAILVGITSFVPAWALLVFGFNETGLYANSACIVLSGVGLCSDALLVLASEVTLKEDREVAFGMFQAATNLISFLLFGLPALLTTTLPCLPGIPIEWWLWYQVVLSILYFLSVWNIRIPRTSTAALDAGETAATPAPAAVAELEAGSSGRGAAAHLRAAARRLRQLPVVSGFLMVLQCAALRRLYLAGALLAFSGDLVFDIGAQYFRDALGLLDSGALHDHQRIAVLSTVPPGLLVIPASVFVGLVAQRVGSLPLLRAMVPIAAVMTASGASLSLWPYHWVIPVVSFAQNIASLALNIPLKHLVVQATPEGRVGEAMGTLGTTSQAINLLANAVTVVLTPALYRHMQKPLWVYYVACGALTLVGALPLWGLSDIAADSPAAEGAKERPKSSATVRSAEEKEKQCAPVAPPLVEDEKPFGP